MIVNEPRRQASVRRYQLPLDSPHGQPDTELTALVVQAQRLMRAERAAVYILDGDRQVTIAGTPGLALDSTDRSQTLCHRLATAYPGRTSFVTTDPGKDPFSIGAPLFAGQPDALSYYAGVLLVGIEGLPLGALCVWSVNASPDPVPDVELLRTVGTAVTALLDSRRRAAEVPGAGDDSDDGPPRLERRSIDSVIDSGAVTILFQPVIHLPTGSVVGFEALSRGPSGTDLESPLALIKAASAAGRVSDLDWLCRVNAMATAAQAELHPGLSWFINVEPASLHDECPPHLRDALASARSDLRIVLEVVERDLNGHVTHLLHAADQARRDVWGVALNDVGSNESSLALLPLLMPDVVKLDMSLVHKMPDSRTAAVTAAVRAYAERTGAEILAKGIETDAHEQLAHVFGATYVQGHRYGRPAPLPESVPAPRSVVPLRQRPTPLDGTMPFDIASARAPVQRAPRQLLEHVVEHITSRCRSMPDPFVLLVSLQGDPASQRTSIQQYRQLSARSALTLVVAGADDGVDSSDRFELCRPPAGSRMRGEWFIAVLSASYSAAFVARACGDRGPEPDSRYDFVVTHDTALVTAVGRAFTQALVPPGLLPLFGQTVATPQDPAPTSERPGPSRSLGLFRRYTRGRIGTG